VFNRGFKSQCERRAVEFRRQLGVAPTGAFMADALAKHIGVTVWSTNQVAGLGLHDSQVLSNEADQSWSALTMRMGSEHLVVHKPVSSKGRRNNVIMHELSHIILGHELAQACILEDGSLVPGNFNQGQEDEADWLAGTLLLPRPALLNIRQTGQLPTDACAHFCVSNEMLTWRMRMTGVDYQLTRSKV
jgi:IrrE N-terminal-like domain